MSRLWRTAQHVHMAASRLLIDVLKRGQGSDIMDPLRKLTRCSCAAQTLTDNLLLYSYQQWESAEAFYEHIKSKTVAPLAEYVKDKVNPIARMI